MIHPLDGVIDSTSFAAEQDVDGGDGGEEDGTCGGGDGGACGGFGAVGVVAPIFFLHVQP